MSIRRLQEIHPQDPSFALNPHQSVELAVFALDMGDFVPGQPLMTRVIGESLGITGSSQT